MDEAAAFRTRKGLTIRRGQSACYKSDEEVVAFGIVLVVVMAISIAIVLALFIWGAREDGREQERVDARLRRGKR